MRERSVLVGNRFEAAVSANRQLADIVDRKRKGGLVLLNRVDLRALKEKVETILESPHRRSSAIFSYKRGNLFALNEEDVRELHELVDALLDFLVDREA
jgi:hypothetical protein